MMEFHHLDNVLIEPPTTVYTFIRQEDGQELKYGSLWDNGARKVTGPFPEEVRVTLENPTTIHAYPEVTEATARVVRKLPNNEYLLSFFVVFNNGGFTDARYLICHADKIKLKERVEL